jgi:SAM-dependent methyltransferase
VTSTDYVPALLERGAERARAERFDVEFRFADAEDLPFEAGAFDAVVSSFGVMFAPDHARAAGELLRVCRKGGRIGLANWTPDGFIGQVFKTLGRHLPPPAGAPSAAQWGDEAYLQSLFGSQAASIVATRRQFNFRYRSPAHFIEVFRTWYGPMHKAFAALPPEGAKALERDLAALLDSANIAGPGVLTAPGDYLEVVVTKA